MDVLKYCKQLNLSNKLFVISKLKQTQQFIRFCYTRCKNLPPVIINKSKTLNYFDINSFNISSKSLNDSNNKCREDIIYSIINKIVPDEYYKYSIRWNAMRFKIKEYIKQLLLRTTNETNVNSIICEKKAGRKNKFDFIIIINNKHKYLIELKFNASKINETPQFVSPMCPSKYLSTSFEEYYYYNFLPKLCNNEELLIPPIELYLNQIHNNSPECMKPFQKKYYKGAYKSSKFSGDEADINYYNLCNKVSKECISKFIENEELNINLLSKYLKESQKNKVYMLYKNNKFYIEQITNEDEYEIISYIKEPKKSRFIAITKTNKKLKILLRWKNGNGIAFPAFQIS